MRAAAALLLAGLSTAGPAQTVTAEQAMTAHDRRTRLVDCPERGRGDAIVVCGRRESDRHRLPPQPRAHGDRLPGVPFDLDEAMSFTAAGASTNSTCGIFVGQRRCSKADMRASGWTNIVESARAAERPPEIVPIDPEALGPR